MRGSYRLAWLGITLKKKEILPQSAADLLASILKKESTIDEDEGNDQKEEKAKLTAENGEEGKVKPDRGAEIEDPKVKGIMILGDRLHPARCWMLLLPS